MFPKIIYRRLVTEWKTTLKQCIRKCFNGRFDLRNGVSKISQYFIFILKIYTFPKHPAKMYQ